MLNEFYELLRQFVQLLSGIHPTKTHSLHFRQFFPKNTKKSYILKNIHIHPHVLNDHQLSCSPPRRVWLVDCRKDFFAEKTFLKKFAILITIIMIMIIITIMVTMTIMVIMVIMVMMMMMISIMMMTRMRMDEWTDATDQSAASPRPGRSSKTVHHPESCSAVFSIFLSSFQFQ